MSEEGWSIGVGVHSHDDFEQPGGVQWELWESTACSHLGNLTFNPLTTAEPGSRATYVKVFAGQLAEGNDDQWLDEYSPLEYA